MEYQNDRALMRQKVMESGGIRPFCTRTGINRQAMYNLFRGALPDYRTICRISAGLGLEGEQIAEMFFSRAGK